MDLASLLLEQGDIIIEHRLYCNFDRSVFSFFFFCNRIEFDALAVVLMMILIIMPLASLMIQYAMIILFWQTDAACPG
jgi:hypothetical protein